MSTSSSPGGRGRHSKGRISASTMANGETSRTTTSKLNKNQHNNSSATDTTTAISPSSNVNIRGNGEHKTTSGGGRTRRRSAPPTNLEGTQKNIGSLTKGFIKSKLRAIKWLQYNFSFPHYYSF